MERNKVNKLRINNDICPHKKRLSRDLDEMSEGDVSIQQLVSLVDSLYTERDPSKIRSIQSYLQSIQKSQDGLEFASLLLSAPENSLNCKFFGALTYTVNLMHFKSNHSNINIDLVLNKLLEHTTNYINDYRFNNPNNLFIIKKLFQNLSIIFNSYPVNHEQWQYPLSPIIEILITGQVPKTYDFKTPDIEQVLPQILNDKIATTLLLDYATSIVEDLIKLRRDTKDVNIHEITQSNVYPVIKVVLVNLFQSQSIQSQLLALEQIPTWVQYISIAESSSVVRYRDTSDIFQYLVQSLQSSEHEIVAKSIEVLLDLFDCNPALLNHDLKAQFSFLISSDWAPQKITELFELQDLETMNNFGSLVIEFLEADLSQSIARFFKNEQNQLLTFLLSLTNIPLTPIIEETISRGFIEFWSQVIDTFDDDFDSISAVLKNDESSLIEVKNNFILTLKEISKFYFQKIQLSIVHNDDYNDSKQAFDSFRDDVGELFSSIYTHIGVSLYQSLATNTSSASNANHFEASLFLLTALSSDFGDSYENTEIIDAVESLFKSDFLLEYNKLVSQVGSDDTNLYAKYSIKFLGSVLFFYKKKPVYLGLVIDYLFNCLKVYPSQQHLVSRTILQICDTCRSDLVANINDFEPILIEMTSNPEINDFTRGKVINSISCIIQSLEDPATQEHHVYNVISLIEEASDPFLRLASKGEIEDFGLLYLISLFRSLLEVAKGLRLDDLNEDEEEDTSKFENLKTFYRTYDRRVQTKVLRLVKTFTFQVEYLKSNPLLTDTAISILKLGVLEDVGPFSFDIESVLEYAIQKFNSSPQSLGSLFELLVTVFNVGLKSSSPEHQRLSQSSALNLLRFFVMDQLENINQDPDLIQLMVSIFTSIITNKPGLMIHEPEIFQFFIRVALSLLYSKEKFIIKSLNKFWTGLLTVKKITADDAKSLSDIVVRDIGAVLTFTVFDALIKAVRSDVDSYSYIIVSLIARHQLHFKGWCQEALFKIDHERTQNGSKGIEDKDIFVKKLLITRGSSRKCLELIKEFWVKANGLVSY